MERDTKSRMLVNYYGQFLVLRRAAVMLARVAVRGLNPSEQSGNKPPSGEDENYSLWLEIC